MSGYVQGEQYAQGDGEELALQVQALRARGFEGRYLLCDGSAYSPSWRALGGGAEAWQLGSDLLEQGREEQAAQVTEAYSEQLTREEEALGLFWEEGCLFYASEGWLEAEALEEAREAGEALGRAEREQGAGGLYGKPEQAPRGRELRELLGKGAATREGSLRLRQLACERRLP